MKNLLSKISGWGVFAPLLFVGLAYSEGIPSSSTAKQLAIEVSGTVTSSADGAVIPGVNILVKGTTSGTITDVEGNYTLTVPNDDDILVFSSIGFITQEVPVNGRSVINVVMVEDLQHLEEVVVVGFGTQKKENLTGAVASVTSEVLESRPITNLGQGLQGQISNLNITQRTGTPGGGASFNIRGYTSINGGDPLILVNNVPMDINLINPNDIESISVLKDAASAAIYGARAAYGVILVTTKSGSNNQKTAVALSFNH